MAEQHKAIISFENPSGFVFGEDLVDHISVYIHQRSVIGSRYLHENDIVSYDRVESPKYPGSFEGVNVKYAGHVVRQLGARSGGRS